MIQQVSRIGLDKWLDVNAWFMIEVNNNLDRLYSKASENNTKSRKYFQAQIYSAMRLEQSKRYNQQYNQSNIISDIIRTNPKVVMVTSLVTSTQRSKTWADV